MNLVSWNVYCYNGVLIISLALRCDANERIAYVAQLRALLPRFPMTLRGAYRDIYGVAHLLPFRSASNRTFSNTL